MLHLLAVLEHLAGNTKVAIHLFEQVITLNPNHSQAYSNLGTIMKKVGRLEEAIAHYQKVINLQPNYVHAYHNLGLVYRE